MEVSNVPLLSRRRNSSTAIRKELLDEPLASMDSPDDLTGSQGLLNELTGALLSRVMDAEMTEHLGYEKNDPEGRSSGNSRNGSRAKEVRTPKGELEVAVPRDRNGTFEPKLIGKRQTRFEGFDDEITSMYGRGMTVREIKAHLERLYSVEVSPDLISRATDAVVDELQAWRNRPLDAVCPIVILDAIVLKVRDQGTVANKAAYVAMGDQRRWDERRPWDLVDHSEGAEFWLGVLTELKTRGVRDILIACCDGLKGFPAANRAAAEAALDNFEETWGHSHPQAVRTWRANWERVVPFLDFPDDIRRVIYTTNAIESLNASLRKAINPRGHFPTEEAALKVLHLAIRERVKRWSRPPLGWSKAVQHFAIHFEDRIPH